VWIEWIWPSVVTFGGRGQGRGARLRVAEEHLLVEAPQSVVGGMGVLLDKDVTGWHDVHHDHFDGHSTGEQQLRTQQRREEGLLLQDSVGRLHVITTNIIRHPKLISIRPVQRTSRTFATVKCPVNPQSKAQANRNSTAGRTPCKVKLAIFWSVTLLSMVGQSCLYEKKPTFPMSRCLDSSGGLPSVYCRGAHTFLACELLLKWPSQKDLPTLMINIYIYIYIDIYH